MKLAALLAVSFLVAGCTKQQPVQAKQDAGPVKINAAPVTSKEIRRVFSRSERCFRLMKVWSALKSMAELSK